jgi:hypothetical protein
LQNLQAYRAGPGQAGSFRGKGQRLKDLDKKQDEAREKMQEIQMQTQKLRQAIM